MQTSKNADSMYLLVVEDVQNEAKEFLGRELNENELFDVKKYLNKGIEWDFYVRRAIEVAIET